MPRATDVDALRQLGFARARADFVPSRQVIDAIHAGHPRAHTFFVGYVTFGEIETPWQAARQLGQCLTTAGRAHQSDYILTLLQELSNQRTTEKSGAAGDEDAHPNSLGPRLKKRRGPKVTLG